MVHSRTGLILLFALFCLLIPISVEARPQAVDCGSVIDEPGTYELAANLSCAFGFPPPMFCSSAAITITAPNVHLNGRGFTITGNRTGVGIRITTTDAHLSNLTVDSFNIGIEVAGGGSHQLNNVASQHNSAFNCGDGIGIEMVSTNDNRFIKNDISNNERWGVRLMSSNKNRFTNNAIFHNQFRPGSPSGNIDLSFSNDNIIQGNNLSSGGVFGARLQDSNGNQIDHNVVIETATPAGFGTGILLTRSARNSIERNWVDREIPAAGTNYIGIQLFEGATQNLVRGNTVLHHSASGIYVFTGATGNTIEGNRAADNTPWDARDDNPNCDANNWQRNRFDAVNQPACIQ